MTLLHLADNIPDRTLPLKFYGFNRVKVGSQWNLQRRCHDDSIIYLILKGSAAGEVDGARVRWQAPQLWWLAPRVPHDIAADSCPLEFYVVRWRVETDASPQRVLTLAHGEQCRDAFAALLDVKNHPHPHNQDLRLRCALVQLLLTIDNAHVTQLSPQRGLSVEHRRRCRALLADKIAYALTPEDLAHACGLRPTYFRRRFKVSFGMSPRRWLAHERMRHAATLLRETDLKVEAVAEACGFSSLPTFSRRFKAEMGISPRQLLRDLR